MAKEMDYQPNMLALASLEMKPDVGDHPGYRKAIFASIVTYATAASRMNYRIIIAQSDESPVIEKRIYRL